MATLKNSLRALLLKIICYKSYGIWSAEKAHNLIYKGQEKSKIFHNILKEIFGDEHPERLESFSFVTRSDLLQVIEKLKLKKGDTFADLGCGRGGPGMWIAEKTDARLIGVDISGEAIKFATERSHQFNLSHKPTFHSGNFYNTKIEESSMDGAISIDSIWYAADRPRAFNEIYRILKTGGSLVFTSWDGNIPLMPPTHKGHLEKSGFKITSYQEIKGATEKHMEIYQKIIDSSHTIIKEMGQKYASPILREANNIMSVAETSTRIIVSAEKN